MEDLRISWMKERVVVGLNLPEDRVFHELLSRENGQPHKLLMEALDQTNRVSPGALIFYSLVSEVEREEEVEEGQFDLLI